MADGTSDRRGFIRVPFNTEVAIDTGGRLIRSNKGINISMSGLHLSSDEPCPAPDTPCRVTINLQSSENRVLIEARGKITRTEPGNMAVEFTELDLDSYHHLRQLILNNTDEPEKAEQEFDTHWGIRRPAL